MDKNTLWGVICMAAIFFGFMYLNKPSQEDLDRQNAAQTTSAAAQQAPAPADSLDARAKSSLADAVRRLGVADANGSYTYRDARYLPDLT